MNVIPRTDATANVPIQPGVDFVRVRFAGDSGDGVQTTGALFTQSAANFGNDFATFPDFPAEIRAPAGTVTGVSTFSINIGTTEILTHGDQPDVLVALNAAALAVHLPELRNGGVLILDSSGFNARALTKAGFDSDPREDGSLQPFQVIEVNISAEALATAKACDPELSRSDALLTKNMWALGLTLWLLDRSADRLAQRTEERFRDHPQLAKANAAAVRAGHAYGETHELAASIEPFDIPPAQLTPGRYRAISGTEALALGAVTAAKLADLPLYYASYPITPASPVLHRLARLARTEPGVTTFQAEDEIAAITAAIGAAYGGALGVTASSGPGVALMTEALGLAIAVELPLVVIDVQRAGPSTGMPTKAEQSDLNLAIFGRNGDTPIPVVAARGPSDCFASVLEAARLAVRYMTPVMLLADGYIANAAEPWLIPPADSLTPGDFTTRMVTQAEDFEPFARDPETLARNWPKLGVAGLEHRIGGLEKDVTTGAISYNPQNHQRMTEIRTGKIDAVRASLPPLTPDLGPATGRLAVLGWGSTYGAIRVATLRARAAGREVSHIHLRHMWPLPPNLPELLAGFDQVLLPELNTGQLATLLRTECDVPVESLCKIAGQPFLAREIGDAINDRLPS